MKIEWNKVTWYSKLVALVLFVALPFIGFYYGAQYGGLAQSLKDQAQNAGTSAGTDYYANVAAWQTDANNPGFSIAYPIDFQTDDNYLAAPAASSANWRMGANGTPGVIAFMLTIPSAFDPQTNFADAQLMVGHSTDNNAVAQCLSPDMTPPAGRDFHGHDRRRALYRVPFRGSRRGQLL